jgi:iron complex outermembrane recepter protein
MARYVRILLVSFAFLSLGMLSSIAYAQDAQLQGQVLDPSGAGVPKALVRVVDQRIGTEARAETNDEGGYTVPALNAGLYKVFVQAAGFSTAASDPITLAPSQNAVLNFTLQVSANATNVVVTAEKREENLLDVPVPVTALDGDTLSENNHVSLQDYFTKVPALNVTQNIVGTQNLSIRGVTTGGLTTPVVGIVIDDVPFGASSGSHGDAAADIDPGDLARIELLRGPQGTLYGADSMGGLVKFVTVDPSTEGYSGRVEAGTSGVYNGDKPGYKLRGSFNVPLSHTLAVRASGFTRQDPGYIDNPILRFRGVNEAEGHGGRASALWRPTDTVSLKVSALFQDDKTNGLNEVDIQPDLTGLQQNYIPGVGGDRATVQAYSGVLKAELGSFEVTSLTGYNVLHVLDSVNFGFAFSPAVLKSFGVSGAPYFSGDAVRKFTQELRALVPIGRKLEWLVGSFYTHESDASYFDVFAQNISTGQIVGTYWDFRQSTGEVTVLRTQSETYEPRGSRTCRGLGQR